jgi:hypothetical protein
MFFFLDRICAGLSSAMNLRRSIPILLLVLIALASVHFIAGSEPSPRLREVTMPLRCTTIEQLKRLNNTPGSLAGNSSSKKVPHNPRLRLVPTRHDKIPPR